MPDAMMYVRLVHLLDREKRKELMTIYGENLAPTGFTVADLSDGGKNHAGWPALADALLAAAQKRITVEPQK